MKYFFSILSFLLLTNFSQAQYSKILSVIRFDNLIDEVKDGYGSINNPIESGAFIDMMNPKTRNAAFVKLYNSYRWPHGEKINFSKRSSTQGGSKGIVDRYVLVNPKNSDTVILFVDPYKTSEKYYVPKGLIALAPTILTPEIEPILQQIEEINEAEDGSKLVLHDAAIIRYISANFNRNILTSHNLQFLATDKKADKTMTMYLMRNYTFNKYYALARDIENADEYAFEKIKVLYKKYMKANPETEIGDLDKHLK